jgi:DNA processing protein
MADKHRLPARRDLLIALVSEQGPGPAAAARLAGDPEAWLAPDLDAPARTAAGLGVPTAALETARRLVPRAAALAAAERRRATAAGARLVTRADDDYPLPLLDLSLPPPVLVVAGEIPPPLLGAGLGVSMVGSRRADAYALEVAERFARQLAAAGLPVVSGFARGVDAAAHRGALDGDGRTVAVLGCGVDVGYPRGHGKLFRRIADGGGAVVSEFPCGTEPRPWHFPIRNRLIAALTLGTVVVRAAERSGSLITARHAADLGREVLAVPGPVFDRLSAGTNRLLSDGAGVAASARDVLDVLLGPSASLNLLREGGGGDEGTDGAGKSPRKITGLKGRVVAAMPVGRELAAEEVARGVEAGVDEVLAVLLELELEGAVRRMPGARYARRGA